MDAQPPRRPYPAGEEPRDPDRSTGPDQGGRGTAPTAGHGSRAEDAAPGLGGALGGEPRGDQAPRGDESALRAEGETGREVGNATLGSSRNAAERVDVFNVPGQGRDVS